jgi:hypothetical protein
MAHTLEKGQDGILYVTISGEFTEEELHAYILDLNAQLEPLGEGERLLSFIDTTELGQVNPNLRRTVGDVMDDPRLGKTAVLGNSRVVKVMIDFVLRASGRSHMRYFTDRDEALAWLLNN